MDDRHTALKPALRFLVAKGVNPGLQDEVVSLVLPDEKFTIFASLGIQKNSEFANTFDFGLMKQAETGAQRKVMDRNPDRNVIFPLLNDNYSMSTHVTSCVVISSTGDSTGRTTSSST